jgi:phosphate butyryltransferase
VQPILIGNKQEISKIAADINFDLTKIEILNATNPTDTAKKAVAIAKSAKANILMKGSMETSILLKAVLDKENGLQINSTLSHITLVEINKYHKLFAVTDAGVNLQPDIKTKIAIINNAINFYHQQNVTTPKIALASASEVINPKLEASAHAAAIVKLYKSKQLPGCIIEGPLALDTIVSKEACQHKGITTQIGGDTDIIIVPEIVAGNLLIKALKYFAGAQLAGFIVGAQIPIALASRADDHITKYLSIICAVVSQ